jgi:hypothetical protein
MSSVYETTITKGHFRVAGKEFPNIKWWTRKNLRTTYFLLTLAILTSATNGYDGSMVNGLLSLPQFITCNGTLAKETFTLLIISQT